MESLHAMIINILLKLASVGFLEIGPPIPHTHPPSHSPTPTLQPFIQPVNPSTLFVPLPQVSKCALYSLASSTFPAENVAKMIASADAEVVGAVKAGHAGLMTLISEAARTNATSESVQSTLEEAGLRSSRASRNLLRRSGGRTAHALPR